MTSKEVIKWDRAFFQKIESQKARKGKLRVAAYHGYQLKKRISLIAY